VTRNTNKLLVVQVAGLGHACLAEQGGGERWCGLETRAARTVFPAVTCPVQASFRTGVEPGVHGMISNAAWLDGLRRPSFWEQSAGLVKGPRFWDELRAAGRTVGVMFWQQSLGEAADVLLSPAPIHKHGGGMVDAMYSRPKGLYDRLVKAVGRRFKLRHYWGPLAGAGATRWIARATAALLAMDDVAPDLLLTYLPHLDYALQRHGPQSPQARKAFGVLTAELTALVEAAQARGYDVMVFGDYAIVPAERVLYPNRALLDAGLLATRRIGSHVYADMPGSRAFAVCDHEAVCLHALTEQDAAEAADVICALDAGLEVLPGIGSADRMIVAPSGTWLAYPWWRAPREAPDFAAHVDIHRKPGYDPCELFFGRHPFLVSTQPERVGGTHGRTGPGREVAWAATFPCEAESVLDLAGRARAFMQVRS
jgi:Type I phosphodiesterase / nucleotide pyrophosphatase